MSLVDFAEQFCILAAEETDDDAYECKEISKSAAEAVAIFRKRIAIVLSVQHLSNKDENLSLIHDRTHGRIVNGGVLIDRTFLTYERFGEPLEAWEGMQFDFKGRSASWRPYQPLIER